MTTLDGWGVASKRESESSQSTHLFPTLNCMSGDCTGSWIWVIALSESGCYLSQKEASAMWELLERNNYKTHPNQQINRFMDIHWHFMMSWPLQRSMLSCWQNQENPQRLTLMVPGLQGWRRFEQVGSHQAMRQLSNALKLLCSCHFRSQWKLKLSTGHGWTAVAALVAGADFKLHSPFDFGTWTKTDKKSHHFCIIN